MPMQAPIAPQKSIATMAHPCNADHASCVGTPADDSWELKGELTGELTKAGGNKKAASLRLFACIWCPGEDSNLHGFTR
jgi:hypothetical protein